MTERYTELEKYIIQIKTCTRRVLLGVRGINNFINVLYLNNLATHGYGTIADDNLFFKLALYRERMIDF